ncbi:hypothetical protein [Shewanella sp. KT0246]|uniref:hypothetical protein n=1 Tax=Shewanella sp. KT0246 TaxID=2815912 RepID=UPI001BBAFF3F|nr:hypothetical protein [Shewanella sp. KT0246]GIU50263.1 hypothetical protein TUM4249_10090 [Shewanella sp. KT0246]
MNSITRWNSLDNFEINGLVEGHNDYEDGTITITEIWEDTFQLDFVGLDNLVAELDANFADPYEDGSQTEGTIKVNSIWLTGSAPYVDRYPSYDDFFNGLIAYRELNGLVGLIEINPVGEPSVIHLSTTDNAEDAVMTVTLDFHSNVGRSKGLIELEELELETFYRSMVYRLANTMADRLSA